MTKTIEEKVEMIKSLQTKTLAKVLSEEQLAELYKKYKSVSAKRSREDMLGKEPSRAELNMLKDFFNPEVNWFEYSKQKGINQQTLRNRVGTVALILLYQNREKIELDKILEGGEQ